MYTNISFFDGNFPSKYSLHLADKEPCILYLSTTQCMYIIQEPWADGSDQLVQVGYTYWTLYIHTLGTLG